jgi:hypothetical protein
MFFIPTQEIQHENHFSFPDFAPRFDVGALFYPARHRAGRCALYLGVQHGARGHHETHQHHDDLAQRRSVAPRHQAGHGLLSLRRNHHFESARRQRTSYDPNLKIYTVEPLGGASGAKADGGAVTNTSTAPEKSGVGKIVMTLAAKFLGVEKLLGYDARHYQTSMQMETSGCCGTGNNGFKTEVWMADIKLPVVDDGSADWKSSYASAYGRDDCRVTMETKGDVKGYEARKKVCLLR